MAGLTAGHSCAPRQTRNAEASLSNQPGTFRGSLP